MVGVIAGRCQRWGRSEGVHAALSSVCSTVYSHRFCFLFHASAASESPANATPPRRGSYELSLSLVCGRARLREACSGDVSPLGIERDLVRFEDVARDLVSVPRLHHASRSVP